ncbi:MAG: leucine--tRNA ligase [Chitinophagales bacterium]|nr:leucine--tRNA ligase [Chitinophagales bacterium]
MEYDFRRIEQEWQQKWKESGIYKVNNDSSKPKYYVLDMFPYPSGAGLHVGHPLGYIASDIYSRYKRLKGFNVLHPMGFDSFGLPAEQYALDTGQHPAVTTKKNIETFKSQLDNIGFCYDWDREVQTSDPKYYKWTQWIFLQLFNSYFCNTQKKARPISELIEKYETKGAMPKPGKEFIPGKHFTADEWKSYPKQQQEEILMNRRLAFSKYGEVNWCEALGTVLANDEVVNGVSERGGHPVEKKKMRQWYLRITAYADRLLEGLETVDFSDSMKEMQRNWIGKSQGAEIDFRIRLSESEEAITVIDKGNGITETDYSSTETEADSFLTVYTTRPDTIFGVDFMVLAPEHELVAEITSEAQKEEIEKYLQYVKSRSDRERQAEVKQITGCFTGAYAINPFNGREIPIWIAEYVLAGYGTGAIMAVPCGDQRDFAFAKHFNIPITNIIGEHYNGEEANPTKDAILENSGFLNGMLMKDAIDVAVNKIEELGIGKRQVNYKMRDAGFSRQRYWGEPFPIKWIDGIAVPLGENELPLELPHVDSYKPGPEGQGPLANIEEWTAQHLETNTMPGYAGSSWYFLRYMDPHNNETFCSRNTSDYWGQVDLYIGGTEHAVGHLLYSRMWTKVLYDLNLIGYDEPYKKLVNQGMIQGVSQIAYVRKGEFEEGVSKGMSNTIFVPAFDNPASTPTPKLQLYSADLINQENKDRFKPFNIPIELVQLNTLDSTKNLLDVDLGVNLFPQRLDAIYIVQDAFYYEGQWRTWNNNDSTWSITDKRDFYTSSEVEKMSKSKYNTINPDELCSKYGADTFRMYEMFLGPVELSKPWDTKGIEGVHRFLKKFWRLFFDEVKGAIWTTTAPSPADRAGGEATDAELKVLHKAIKKIEDDTERFSFNTAVSAFMIATNELSDLKCHKKEILEPLLILLTPYAPHIAEELWKQLGHQQSVLDASYPVFEEKYVKESSKAYPVAVNGKTRSELTISLTATQQEVEALVLADEKVQKWLDGKSPKKIIYVKNKMINVVV